MTEVTITDRSKTQIRAMRILYLLATFIVAAVGLTFGTQATASTTNAIAPSQTALYKSTVQFKLAAENKPEIYALMATATAAAREGKSAKEIVEAVARARQAQFAARSIRETGKWISPNASSMIIDAASALGSNRGGPALAALARGTLWTVEAAGRGRKIYWAYRQHTSDRLTEPEAQRYILDRFTTGYDDYPELKKATPDLAITHEIGISPSSTREMLVASAPDKEQRDMMKRLLDAQGDQHKLTQLTVTMLADIRLDQAGLTKTTLPELDDVKQLVEQDKISRARAKREMRARQALAIKIRGVESMVYLASTLIGLDDPQLGHQIQTIGDASIKVYNAWNTFAEVTQGFSELRGFASAALSADLVGAALAVVGLFIDAGPTPDEIIIEQIGELREQVEQGRVQMHQRFNLVDRRLVDIHTTLVGGLDDLKGELKKDREAAARFSAEMQEKLVKQQELLTDLYPASIDRAQAILKSIQDRALAECVRRRELTTIPIPFESFVNCVAQIQSLVLDGEIERLQIRSPYSHQNLVEALLKFPDSTVNAAARKFHEISPRVKAGKALFPDSIVGPESWIFVARAHDSFLRDWPQHRGKLRSNASYAKRMNEHRDKLEQAIEAIGADLVAYSEGEGEKTAFGALVGSVREKKKAIARAIKRASRKWRKARQVKGEPRWDRAPGTAGSWPRLRRKQRDALLGDTKRVVYGGEACRDREWKNFENGTSLFFWLDPRLPRQISNGESKDERDERFAQQEKRLEERVRKDLWNMLPRSIGAMLATGLGKLEVCMLGNLNKGKNNREGSTTLRSAPNQNDPSRGAYYRIRYRAKVLFNVRWRAKCERGTFERDADGFGKSNMDLEIAVWPKENYRSAYHDITVDTADLNRSLRSQLMKDAYGKARDDAERLIERLARDLEDSSCIETYRKLFFKKKRAWISDVIVGSTAIAKAISDYDREVKIANAYVRAWIRLALYDAIGLSDLVAALATGSVRFPLWEDASETGMEETMADRPRRLEELIQTVESVLKSEEVGYMAAEHARYAGVMDTAYDSLDPDHPDVKLQRELQGRLEGAN